MFYDIMKMLMYRNIYINRNNTMFMHKHIKL